MLLSAILYLALTPQSSSAGTFSEDEIAVYRVILNNYAVTRKLAGARLNLSTRAGLINDRAKECLEAIKAQKPKSNRARTFLKEHFQSLPYIRLVAARTQLEKIRENDSPRSTSQLVEQSGMLTLSEIWFDSDHCYALLSFTFNCGRRCGHGSTYILKKVKGKWVQMQHVCESWISANPSGTLASSEADAAGADCSAALPSVVIPLTIVPESGAARGWAGHYPGPHSVRWDSAAA